MKALVVYAHPSETSYTAAVRDVVRARLDKSGAETRLIDLYAQGFNPVLDLDCWIENLNHPRNVEKVRDHAEALEWADTLIFVYPTWWYGLPAILKGWLDRTLAAGVAFHLPEEGDIKPGLTHITRLGVFTTCGASRWLSYWIGQPGRRTLLRGVRILCAGRLRTCYLAHYNMDRSTPDSRARHLDRVGQRMDRLLA